MELYFLIGPDLTLPLPADGTPPGTATATDCTLDLLVALLAEPAFDQLRTKEQLGYSGALANFAASCHPLAQDMRWSVWFGGVLLSRVVDCSARRTAGVLGLCFTVSSAEHAPAAIVGRIEAFLLQWRSEGPP
eukprot:SAG11_NODE_106_length_16423_cov_51.220840_25_plen_133_part_00